MAKCACQLTEGRVTPSAGLEEVLEAMTVVIDLLHTARYPHLHQDAREGSYTPARLRRPTILSVHCILLL